jgi:signal transduction histidine kinase
MNLVSNSLKFTSNGTIQISLNYDVYKNILKVNVRDTGPGVKKED